MRLKGKTALITGAASGIGRACAIAFAREGACVAVLDINAENGAAVEKTIREAGGEAVFIKTDMTVLADIEAAVSKTAGLTGKIDVLMNNAGGGAFFSIHEMDEEKDFDLIFDLNIKSMFRMCKLVIPHMAANNGGSIINVGSVGGITAMPNMASYGASKAAVAEFTKTVAVEYAG
ncbi:MAG: SDR family oxidoreductase, partial [Clostridiales bacterium]|nr:SDR family oxidoreductase [Clostridiales bacterium]